MNETDFRNWLAEYNLKKKVQSDYVSRLKRLEKELEIDIDEQFEKDRLEYVLSLFKNMGQNEEMKAYGEISLPIGKYYLATYSNAIKRYIQFRNAITNEK